LGRLDLPAPVLEIITRQNQENGIVMLPISLEHIVAMTRLPIYHNDVFDHLLITQAMVENLVILTKDPLLAKYPVKTLW
jgi:PIN domain nuclease of toxin-antitoxin system